MSDFTNRLYFGDNLEVLRVHTSLRAKLVQASVLLLTLFYATPGTSQTYLGLGGSPISPAVHGSVYVPMLSKTHVTISAGYHWQDTTEVTLFPNSPPDDLSPIAVQEKPAVFGLVGLQTLLNDGIFIGGAVGIRHYKYNEAEWSEREVDNWKFTPKSKTEIDYSGSLGFWTEAWGIKGEYNPHRIFALEFLLGL